MAKRIKYLIIIGIMCELKIKFSTLFVFNIYVITNIYLDLDN